MKQILVIVVLMVMFSTLSSWTPGEDVDLTGTWIRNEDNLRIKVFQAGDKQTLTSFIVEEGNEKFPCDVSALAIYKNIRLTKPQQWTCDFLVVTMRSCTTEYEQGYIRITKAGEMEVNCPGFARKVYKKLKPRYSTDS